MLSALLSIMSSSGLGAILGVVGSFITKKEERKTKDLELKHDIALANCRIEEARIESEHELAMAEKQIERAQIEGAIQTDLEDTKAFAKSLAVQSKATGIGLVDAIRGIIRPFLTVYIIGVVTYLAVIVGIEIGGIESLDKAYLIDLYTQIINTILFLASTSYTWWFGSRLTRKKQFHV